MKYILTMMIMMLVLLTACGDEGIKTANSTENISNTAISDVEEKEVPKQTIKCEKDFVAVDGECLPIDPYDVIKDEDEEEIMDEATEEPEIETNVKTFKITVDNYDFYIDGKVNPDMRVKVNDTVIVELYSNERSHNWNVAKFAARSRTLMTNESTTLEFVAHTAGTYQYYCAVGKHRDVGQRGNFIVE